MKLTDYVKQVSLEDFGRPFSHNAQWNSRLRTTGGRFFPKDGHLDFNPKVYNELGLEVFRKIVRHELCHYHLYFQGKGYQHKDRDFKELLRAVDGLRFVQPCLIATPSQSSSIVANLASKLISASVGLIPNATAVASAVAILSS
ncbi:putative metallopeptidase (Zinc) SprT family [Streptococcus oralis]|uniref:Putative metallopeptidase (Zinc) SprT family n=1 Tax=Streptococcus oralis TaxID=1303 RepID=A0A139P1N3_STROR|nr:putative metallopeptidase (Zinc) SprT family [Streptococcus oralis]